MFFEAGWVTLSADFRRKGRRPPITVGIRKLKRLPLRVVSKYRQCIWFCHKARMWQTDRWTDGQNYSPKTTL